MYVQGRRHCARFQYSTQFLAFIWGLGVNTPPPWVRRRSNINSNFMVGQEIQSVYHFCIQLPSHSFIVEKEIIHTEFQPYVLTVSFPKGRDRVCRMTQARCQLQFYSQVIFTSYHFTTGNPDPKYQWIEAHTSKPGKV